MKWPNSALSEERERQRLLLSFYIFLFKIYHSVPDQFREEVLPRRFLNSLRISHVRAFIRELEKFWQTISIYVWISRWRRKVEIYAVDVFWLLEFFGASWPPRKNLKGIQGKLHLKKGLSILLRIFWAREYNRFPNASLLYFDLCHLC